MILKRYQCFSLEHREKRPVISFFRSSACPQADGELKKCFPSNQRVLYKKKAKTVEVGKNAICCTIILLINFKKK